MIEYKIQNYFEYFSWIENKIDSCNNFQDFNNIYSFTNKFVFILLDDKNVNPFLFKYIIDKLSFKLNSTLTEKFITVDEYSLSSI